jgi:glutamyl-tRNA reductase
MSQAASTAVIALVTHARCVPAEQRGRFVDRVREGLSDRALVIDTCHRVEAYLVSADDPEHLAASVSLPSGGSALIGEPAIRHAIGVAVGRDSVVVGEDQILHQIRVAVDASRESGALDPTLERLFGLALRAGRRARSWRQGPQRSLADVALSVIARLGGPLPGREVLVVGTGRMGQLAARAALGAGASVSVANRSAAGAQSVATATGARIEAFDPGAGIAEFDGIVVALGGPWPIAATTIEAVTASTTVLVDLSVPAAVPVVLAEALGPRFVSADALALDDADLAAPPDGSRARVDGLVDRATADFVDWLQRRGGRTTAEALVSHADREREAELAALWRLFPDLEPEAREAIEGMTRHLAHRLLREPLERLGRDVDGRDERAVRDLFAL